MKHLLIKLCLFNILFIFEVKACAQNNLPPFFEIYTDTASYQVLDSNYWQLLPDVESKFTFEQVSHKPLSDSFQSITALGNDQKKAFTYWFRYRLKNQMSSPARISLTSTASKADYYILGNESKMKHYATGRDYLIMQKDGLKQANAIPVEIAPSKEITIYYKRYEPKGIPPGIKISFRDSYQLIKAELTDYENNYFTGVFSIGIFFSGIFLLSAIFNFLFFITVREKVYLYLSLSLFFFSFSVSTNIIKDILFQNNYYATNLIYKIVFIALFFLIHFIRYYFKTFSIFPKWDKIILIQAYLVLANFICSLFLLQSQSLIQVIHTVSVLITLAITVILMIKRKDKTVKFFLVAMAPFLSWIIIFLLLFIAGTIFNSFAQVIDSWSTQWADAIIGMLLSWAAIVFSWALFDRYNTQKREIARQELDKERLGKEKEKERSELIERQKIELEKTVDERTAELKHSLENLKSTQSQLIQSEKMASLGELTAGIAHEIQNPLNFVNNFSEVNKELLVEMKEEMNKGNIEDANAIANDVIDNEEKINHHGKRADAIVKGMLEHSKASTGKKELTDINKLADEYLRLSYHGLRAKDKSFNADFKTDFDESIGKINIVPQDIGRVLLNLINNAFYAVNEKKKSPQSLKGSEEIYEPTVLISTKRINPPSGVGGIEISVSDNGNGIPQKIVDKIFQPFFTTKPTGSGTGLGLSLSYDIIKAHGGEIKVESKEGEGSVFIVQLPVAREK